METSMELNKETASRLWNAQFGRTQKAVDFSGRTVARAAYNDRNSEYGWNVDHILPQSRGGKTADHNLICCHILTNDEKADRFPCFRANGKTFEIQKRQNHYEIIAKSADRDKQVENVNFLDAAQGLKCWRKCKSGSGEAFVGYVKVRVEASDQSGRILEQYRTFLSELFCTDTVFVEDNTYLNPFNYANSNYRKREFIYTVIVYDEDAQNLLDDCVTLNTYSIYFTNKTGLERIRIVCGMESYDNHLLAATRCKRDILEKSVPFDYDLAIDELVKTETDADKEPISRDSKGFYRCDFIYKDLEQNLKKLI